MVCTLLAKADLFFFFFLTQLQQTSPCPVLPFPCFLWHYMGPLFVGSSEQLFAPPYHFTVLPDFAKMKREDKQASE